MTGRQEINFSTDFPNVKLTHSNFLIFATTITTEQPTNVPLVDKHPVQYIDQMASVSTHSQIVLSLLQGKRALLMGQYLLARKRIKSSSSPMIMMKRQTNHCLLTLFKNRFQRMGGNIREKESVLSK